MSLLKRRVAAALVVIGVASLVTLLQVEANHETDDQIGTEAIWNPANEDLNEINKACKGKTPSDYSACFMDEMGGYASSEAVGFTQLLEAQKPARLGYLDGIKEAGIVDLGYVIYPDATTAKQGWILMNGVPALVNVDDLSLLPQARMQKDPQYVALKKSHPQLQLVVTEDQRRTDAFPQLESNADGSERFLIPYALEENCLGCAPVGYAIFNFEFDAAGQFRGKKFIKIVTK